MATYSIFLPGEFHDQRALGGYSPRGCKAHTQQLLVSPLRSLCRQSMRLPRFSWVHGSYVHNRVQAGNII